MPSLAGACSPRMPTAHLPSTPLSQPHMYVSRTDLLVGKPPPATVSAPLLVTSDRRPTDDTECGTPMYARTRFLGHNPHYVRSGVKSATLYQIILYRLGRPAKI